MIDKIKSKNRELPIYAVKGLELSVKDIDAQTRRVKIALSAFGNVDSDRDVIIKGAFSKSIQERGPESTSNRKIAFLRYHDWEHQIGKFISLEETDQHLLAVCELGKSTKGNDALLDYQDGIIREHSIGFRYIYDKMELVEMQDPSQSYWRIKEVDLWEGSAVTFGANSLTPTLDVSKGNVQDQLKELNLKMESFISALRTGQGTDERLYQIEMGLKACQQRYISLINPEPSNELTQEKEAERLSNERKKLFLSNLNY
jgi:HK97 family phage prohead protease